jgi:hypothetical protein
VKSFALVFVLLLLIAAPTPGNAQNTCATPYGACVMNVPGVAGGPCFCVTPSGNVQGITQGAIGGAPTGGDSFPHFCCTPAGRMGPYPNSTTGPGQGCQAATPTGVLLGQACF